MLGREWGLCLTPFVQMGLASGLPTLVHDVLRNSGEGVKAAFFMALILKSCPACVPLTHTLLAMPGFIVEVCHGQGSHTHASEPGAHLPSATRKAGPCPSPSPAQLLFALCAFAVIAMRVGFLHRPQGNLGVSLKT